MDVFIIIRWNKLLIYSNITPLLLFLCANACMEKSVTFCSCWMNLKALSFSHIIGSACVVDYTGSRFFFFFLNSKTDLRRAVKLMSAPLNLIAPNVSAVREFALSMQNKLTCPVGVFPCVHDGSCQQAFKGCRLAPLLLWPCLCCCLIRVLGL